MSTINSAVLDILKRGRTEDTKYYLPPEQLERKLYQEVNEVLERIGGKWNCKVKAHVFEDVDPAQLLELIFETEEMPPKNPTAFFATPEEVAWLVVDGLPHHAKRILEPSAGKGNIARAIRTYCQQHGMTTTIECCEILPRFQEKLQAEGFDLVASDFLTFKPEYLFDAILMNPPFSLENDSLAYVAHIEHAWNLLAPGGMLRAIAPNGFAFRSDKRIVTLRSQVEMCGEWQQIENGAFKESGTGIRTVMITMRKPATALQSRITPEAILDLPHPKIVQTSLWDNIA